MTTTTQSPGLHGWALILGASSGFGGAASLALAKAGMHIFGVHLDRKATMPNVERIVTEIKQAGREAVFFNVNASDPEKRREVLDQMEKILADQGEPSDRNVERIVTEIKQAGREAVFFNVNASDPEKRREVLDQMEKILADQGEPSSVKVILHSLAFGTLKPFLAPSPKDAITVAQMDMTLDVMAHSLVYWVQELVTRKLMVRGGRVYAMTSSGGAP